MSTGQTTVGVSVAALASIGTLSVVAISAALDAPALVFVACPFIGQVGAAVFAAHRALRVTRIGLHELSSLLTNVHFRGDAIASEARPALVIWIMLPLAFQTDRIILSHLSSEAELAAYNIAAQFYNAGFSIIAAGSAALWGRFAYARLTRSTPERAAFLRLCAAFGIIGLSLGAAITIFLPPIGSLLSSGDVSVSISLSSIFGLLLVVQALHQPGAMFQTDAAGLRVAAWLFCGMTAANLALGLIATPYLGAVGPVLASVTTLLILVAVPLFVRAMRLLGNGHDSY
jgi:O-antigen/teichoic acid export membrane protein